MKVEVIHEDKFWIELPTRDGNVRIDAVALFEDLPNVPAGPKRQEWMTKNFFDDEHLYALDQNGVIEWSEYSGTCKRGLWFDMFLRDLGNALRTQRNLHTHDGGPNDLVNSVHCLIVSMIEQGYDGTESWFGQDFLHVRKLLESMGRSCKVEERTE